VWSYLPRIPELSDAAATTGSMALQCLWPPISHASRLLYSPGLSSLPAQRYRLREYATVGRPHEPYADIHASLADALPATCYGCCLEQRRAAYGTRAVERPVVRHRGGHPTHRFDRGKLRSNTRRRARAAASVRSGRRHEMQNDYGPEGTSPRSSVVILIPCVVPSTVTHTGMIPRTPTSITALALPLRVGTRVGLMVASADHDASTPNITGTPSTGWPAAF